MSGKQEIAEEECSCRVIEDRQIVVGVCRRPGFERERPVTEIQIQRVGDEDGRRNDVRARERCVSNTLASIRQITVLASIERRGELVVADEFGPSRLKAALPSTWSGCMCELIT